MLVVGMIHTVLAIVSHSNLSRCALLTILQPSAGYGIKLAVACAPVKRIHRNQEYSARDYEVGWTLA